ncbi:MAG TPA: hypothetical protein VFA20_35250 [Myxococcaceae bacterium]|nr:hypothetical protein [Myxococcaceae bacterium]
MKNEWNPRWMGLALAVSAALGCGEPPSTQGLHGACTPGSQCARGQRCLEYTGLAGPLSTCEIPCSSKSDCPEPLNCTAVSDGPNQLVCN